MNRRISEEAIKKVPRTCNLQGRLKSHTGASWCKANKGAKYLPIILWGVPYCS